MTSTEAAELITILHGAYPGTYFDGPVAETFANSFVTNDYAFSKQAVHEWVSTMDRFPTIAELNRHIRRLKGTDVPDNIRQLPRKDEPVDVKIAAAAFERGYRRAREQAEDAEADIARKLSRLLQRFDGSVSSVM